MVVKLKSKESKFKTLIGKIIEINENVKIKVIKDFIQMQQFKFE